MAKKTHDDNDAKGKNAEAHEESKSSQENKSSDFGSQAKGAIEKAYSLARNVQRDTIAYVILAAGLVLLPWWPQWGGALVGFVFGTYFSDELVKRVTLFRNYWESEGQAKNIALIGFVVALLVMLPTLVLGAAAAAAIVALITRSSS